MHGIHLAQRQRQEEREADHRAGRADGQRTPVPARRQRRAREPAGRPRSAAPATAARPAVTNSRRQLRVAGVAHGQPRHRQRHREDHHAEQAEAEDRGCRRRGGIRVMAASLARRASTEAIHFSAQTAGPSVPMTDHTARPDADPGLSRAAGTTLAEQLAARFAERIAQRLLAPGARLPSVRDCARRHGVSPSTVVGAYDLLQARGLVQARPQRGFFVRDRSRPARARAEPRARRRRRLAGAGGRHRADPQHVPGPGRPARARHGHAARSLARRRRCCTARCATSAPTPRRPGCATASPPPTRARRPRCRAAGAAQRAAQQRRRPASLRAACPCPARAGRPAPGTCCG